MAIISNQGHILFCLLGLLYGWLKTVVYFCDLVLTWGSLHRQPSYKPIHKGNLVAHIKASSNTTLRARDLCISPLSLVEKAEPIQVHFTLRLKDQWSMWMQDGCNVYMDSYMASSGSCIIELFSKIISQGRPNTKPGDHSILNAHNRWFIVFYHVWRPTWVDIY